MARERFELLMVMEGTNEISSMTFQVVMIMMMMMMIMKMIKVMMVMSMSLF